MLTDTLDSKVGERLKPFRISIYLKQGWHFFTQRFLSMFLISIVIGGFNVLLDGILGWYWILTLPFILYPSLYASYYGLANGVRTRDYRESDDFFIGIEHVTSLGLTRFTQTALQFLLILPIILLYKPLLGIITLAVGIEISESMIYAPSIIFILLLTYMTVAYIFTDQYIVFKNQNYWQAMTSSRKRVNKQFLSVFLLLFILFVIGLFITLLFFTFYLYSTFNDNDRNGIIHLLKNIEDYALDINALRAALLFLVCFAYPYTYCVLHAAFADIEDLPKEEQNAILPS